MSTTYDLVVIGGGPAGYVGAIRAAQMGLKVACVERDALGGTCLNWGCIPTKALLAAADLMHKIKHEANAYGITVGGVSHDFAKVIARSRGVAGNLNKGIGFLFKKHKIDHVQGHAHIDSPKTGCCDAGERLFTVSVYKDPGKTDKLHTLSAKKVLIATGAAARPLPGVPFDGDKVLNAKQAMTLTTQPKKLLVIGSGAIGMEFANFFNAFGTEVTIVEMQERVMPLEDDDISAEIAKSFKKDGIHIRTGTLTKNIEVTASGIKATLVKASAPEGPCETIEADKVLVAIGVAGRFDGLFDDTLGIEVERGHIKVDYRAPGSDYATSVPGIHAVGDVIGPPWLAHVASEEAITAVERMFEPEHQVPDIDYSSVPGCTYCHPQVASIGLTERACKEQGRKVAIGKFPFAASGKAQAMNATGGFVKLITDDATGEILGCHMIGENVTELIAEIGLARRLEATIDDVIATMHAHPTLSEALHEAALGTQGRMIHA